MSQTISHSVVFSLKKLVQDEPKCIYKVKVNSLPQFIILGQFNFYFLDEQLFPSQNRHDDQCFDDKRQRIVSIDQSYESSSYETTQQQMPNNNNQGLVKYAYSDLLRISIDPQEVFLFMLTTRRQNGPKTDKIIQSTDRQQIIDSFRCYWQIDFMYKQKKFKNLEIVRKAGLGQKEKIDQTVAQVPPQLQRPEPGYISHDLMHYRFHIPSECKKEVGKKALWWIENKHADSSSRMHRIEIFIQKQFPIDYLDKMDFMYKDIQTLALNFAQMKIQESKQLFQQQAQSSSLNQNQQHLQQQSVVINSSRYIKKTNLIGDRAQWNCWQVVVRKKDIAVDTRTNKHKNQYQDLVVTLMRRKYIPPLGETFQDIYIISQFNLPEGRSPQEQIRASLRFLQFKHSHICDTCHFISKIWQMDWYHIILKEKEAALLFDEDTIAFYHQELQIGKLNFFKGCYYLISILTLIESGIDSKATENLKAVGRILSKLKEVKYNQVRQILIFQEDYQTMLKIKSKHKNSQQIQQIHAENQYTSQLDSLLKQMEDLDKEMDAVLKRNPHDIRPEDIISFMIEGSKVEVKEEKRIKQQFNIYDEDSYDQSQFKSGILASLGQGIQKRLKNMVGNWTYKVGRYLAYCIDGGILFSQFNLSILINNFLPIVEYEVQEKLLFQLAYLLQFRKRESSDNPKYSSKQMIMDGYGKPKEHIAEILMKIAKPTRELENYEFNQKVAEAIVNSGQISLILRIAHQQDDLIGNKQNEGKTANESVMKQAKGKKVDPSLVPQILMKFLSCESVNIILKQACCRHIINILTPNARGGKSDQTDLNNSRNVSKLNVTQQSRTPSSRLKEDSSLNSTKSNANKQKKEQYLIQQAQVQEEKERKQLHMLIEPLIEVAASFQGETLTIYALRALILLCNYCKENKEQFLECGGEELILQFLPSLNQTILTHILQLMDIVIVVNEESKNKFALENDSVELLLNNMKGIDLPGCNFSPRIYSMIIKALMELMHILSVTRKIMNIEHRASLENLIFMIMPEQIANGSTPPYLESKIYIYLQELSKQDQYNKSVIGNLTIEPVFLRRIHSILTSKQSQYIDPSQRQNSFSFSSQDQVERNFLILLVYLVSTNPVALLEQIVKIHNMICQNAENNDPQGLYEAQKNTMQWVYEDNLRVLKDKCLDRELKRYLSSFKGVGPERNYRYQMTQKLSDSAYEQRMKEQQKSNLQHQVVWKDTMFIFLDIVDKN